MVITWRRDIEQQSEVSDRERWTTGLVADRPRNLGLEAETGVAHHHSSNFYVNDDAFIVGGWAIGYSTKQQVLGPDSLRGQVDFRVIGEGTVQDNDVSNDLYDVHILPFLRKRVAGIPGIAGRTV